MYEVQTNDKIKQIHYIVNTGILGMNTWVRCILCWSCARLVHSPLQCLQYDGKRFLEIINANSQEGSADELFITQHASPLSMLFL